MMDEDQEFIDAMEDRQRVLAELNFESSEIKLDAVLAEDAENAEEEASPELSQSDSAPTDSDSELASNNDLTVDKETDVEAVNDNEEEEPVPDFDIQLREALRIMVDAVETSPNTNDWKQPALPLASSKSRFNKLLN